MLGRAAILGLSALALTACTFDGSGVQSDDDGPDGSTADGDGDGVADGRDNCPTVANPDQHDEDGDDIGNACDNCPSVSNADQANTGDSDTAGDVCDPAPQTDGNDILFFEGFDSADVLTDWRVFGGGTWSVSGGALRQTATTAGLNANMYLASETFGAVGVVFDARVTVDGMHGAGGGDAFGTLVAFATGPNLGAGYHCVDYQNDAVPTSSATFNLLTLRGSQAYQTEDAVALPLPMAVDTVYDVRQTMRPNHDIGCVIASSALPDTVTLDGSDTQFSSGFIGLRTSSVSAHVDFVVVYANP